MIGDDPMRAARRLHDEGWCLLHRSWEPLRDGDATAYSELVSRAMALFAAARWAADQPSIGPQLLREHGIDFHENEAPTARLRPLPTRST